jgi:hypothetical protein
MAASAPTVGSCIRHRSAFPGNRHPTEFHYFNWTDIYGASGFPRARRWRPVQLRLDLVLDSQQGADMGQSARSISARLLRARTGCSPGRHECSSRFNGWKQRAIWSNYGTHFVWHIEGGKASRARKFASRSGRIRWLASSSIVKKGPRTFLRAFCCFGCSNTTPFSVSRDHRTIHSIR